jgi:dihydroorotate dehydrogenase (NAD+) catalytic subunit
VVTAQHSSPATIATPDLRVALAGLELANPILTASGTFGYGLEFAHLVSLERLGGIVTKGLSPEPIRGNPPPRICETRGGMLNSIGLQNIGIERFVAEVLPALHRYPAKIIVNVFGRTAGDYLRVVARAQACPEIAALELNVSCPNVERGGIEFGHDPDALARLVAAVRQESDKPLIVKLSPNVTSPVEIGHAAKEGGADILSCINTVLGMAIDAVTRRPLLHTLRGGLSGPAIKPIALRIVFDVARQVGLPVIGIGGIETATDVVEFLLAGASAVQVGTALFRDPSTPEVLLTGLRDYLRDSGTPRVADLVGALRLPAPHQAQPAPAGAPVGG